MAKGFWQVTECSELLASNCRLIGFAGNCRVNVLSK